MRYTRENILRSLYEKNNIGFIIAIVVIAVVIGGAIGYGSCFIVNRADKQNNSGIESVEYRERELLERIREYERREKDRTARENSRIEREGKRIEETEKRLGAIRELNRRTGDLYEELAMEVGTLQDFYLNFKREYYNALDYINSEISNGDKSQ